MAAQLKNIIAFVNVPDPKKVNYRFWYKSIFGKNPSRKECAAWLQMVEDMNELKNQL